MASIKKSLRRNESHQQRASLGNAKSLNLVVLIISEHWDYIRNYQNVHIKWVKFII